MIIINPRGGLCNRIRAIYSAVNMAQDKKDELYILWEVLSWEVPCNFEDIFSGINCAGVKITVVNVMPYKNSIRVLAKRGKLIELITELKIRVNYRKVFTTYKRKTDCFIDLYSPLPENFNLEGCQKIYIISCDEIYGNRSYDMIRFQPEFYKQAQKIIHCPKDSIIGIHIRRTDASKENESSSLKLFAEKMEENIKKNSGIKFFVSTDDESELIELRKRFGEERIIAQNKTYERFSLIGQKEAVIDLLCLAYCSKMYGCVYSTFGYVASKIGNIELERVGKRRE